jgi:hypothetical protein
MFDFLHTMKGPDFLWLFVGWFVAVRLTVAGLRAGGFDTAATTFLGLLCFEALGFARIVVGSSHGLHKWEFLYLLMFVGGVIFFVRARHLNSDTSDREWFSSSGSSCSSGSSSGGGCGGGGGGCGGCGGS